MPSAVPKPAAETRRRPCEGEVRPQGRVHREHAEPRPPGVARRDQVGRGLGPRRPPRHCARWPPATTARPDADPSPAPWPARAPVASARPRRLAPSRPPGHRGLRRRGPTRRAAPGCPRRGRPAEVEASRPPATTAGSRCRDAVGPGWSPSPARARTSARPGARGLCTTSQALRSRSSRYSPVVASRAAGAASSTARGPRQAAAPGLDHRAEGAASRSDQRAISAAVASRSGCITSTSPSGCGITTAGSVVR